MKGIIPGTTSGEEDDTRLYVDQVASDMTAVGVEVELEQPGPGSKDPDFDKMQAIGRCFEEHDKKLAALKQAEIKHCRLGMMAFSGLATQTACALPAASPCQPEMHAARRAITRRPARYLLLYAERSTLPAASSPRPLRSLAAASRVRSSGRFA